MIFNVYLETVIIITYGNDMSIEIWKFLRIYLINCGFLWK